MLGLKDYLAIGKLVALLGALALICWQSSQIHRWHTQSDHCAEARKLDRQSYETAQKQAQVDNAAHVQQIEKTYQENSDNAKDAYLRDLAELRRLRGKGTAAPQSAPSGTGSPAPDHATPRIDEAGLCVPATSDVCEAGAEIELRLMHAQNLLLQQSAVDPNSPPAR